MNKSENKTIYIATNKFIDLLNNIEKHLLKEHKFKVVNINNNNKMDIFDASIEVGKKISEKPDDSIGIIIDEYGNGGFIIASKFQKTIVAQLSDEHSAHMTRGHNNTNIVTLGGDLTAEKQILIIIDKYLRAKFDGGRHMVRIDMLDEMLKENK